VALALFGATVLAVAAMAVLGVELPPRSSTAYVRDSMVWGAALLSILLVSIVVRSNADSRSRLARCIWVSVLAPLILGIAFKYGLLVPLPNEGVTVEILDRIRYGVPGLLSQ
jgi:uncharacterized protein YqhQ